MTSERRFEHDLPELLGQLAMGPTPDYRTDIVERTAHMRQRPAWTFPERWLPMTAVTTRAASAPVPWRILALVALLLIALAVGALFLVGSRPGLPAPFGPAANGHIAYSAGGDIYTVDPVSGASAGVVTGSDTDVEPVFSLDGTRIVFQRKVCPSCGDGRLYVTSVAGGQLVALTDGPQSHLGFYGFSPDGRDVVFSAGWDASTELWIAKADGIGASKVDVGMGVDGPVYRPPNGAEIVFASFSPTGSNNGIYALDVASRKVRPILAPTAGVGRGWVRVSPDGSRIAYSASTFDPNRNTYLVHVVSIDGTGDIVLPMPKGATFQDAPEWSNDGTRLAVARGYATYDQDMVLAVVPADGSGVGVETTKHRLTSCCSTVYGWSPDDSTILLRPNGFQDQNPIQQLLWDPATGATKPASWGATSLPAWQRRAP